MSKEKIFRGVMIFYIVCLCFLIGMIAQKFTLHSKPQVRPIISVRGLEVNESTSPEELVNHIYQWIKLDSQRSKTIFANGLPILNEEESRTNIVELFLEPRRLVNKLIDLTVGIRYGQPGTYVSSSIPQLEVYEQKVAQVAQMEQAKQEETSSREESREPQIIVGESGKIYLGIPKEEMLHQKYQREQEGTENLPAQEDQLENPQLAQNPKETSDRVTGEEKPAKDSANIRIEKTKPRILIYHTHATETYLDDLNPQDPQSHVFLPNKGKIVDVGATFAKSLREHGFEVYHDQTNYMMDGILNAYTNSLKGVSKSIREQYYDVVLDLHRDGTGLPDAVSRRQYVATVNGKEAARVLLLISVGKESIFKTEEELDRVYPNRKENYAFAANFASKMQETYPGLLRRLEPTKSKLYNQQIHRHALLVEVGFQLNTVEEALYTGELLGDVLAELYKDQPASVLINQ